MIGALCFFARALSSSLSRAPLSLFRTHQAGAATSREVERLEAESEKAREGGGKNGHGKNLEMPLRESKK